MKSLLSFLILSVSALSWAGENRWTSNGPFGGDFALFSFHPGNNKLIFASGSDTIFRSRNGGLTWQRLNIRGASRFPGAFVVRIHPRDQKTIFAAGQTVFRSTDQGENWQQLLDGSLFRPGLEDLELHPDDPKVLYTVGPSGFFKSSDGGATWIKRNNGLNLKPSKVIGTTQIEVDPTKGNTLYLLSLNQRVFKSTNAGESWRVSSKGLDFSSWTSQVLVINPRNPKILYAGGANIARSTDAGATWKILTECCAVRTLAIDRANPDILYADGAGGDVIFKSIDGGSSFTTIVLDRSFLGVAVHPKNSRHVFAGAWDGGLFRSTDSGKTWKATNNGVDAHHIVHILPNLSKPNQLFALGSIDALRSENAGKTWKVIDALLPSFFSISALDVHPLNPKLIAAGGAATQQPIALSKDGGNTFQQLSPFAGIRCNCVKFHPANQNIIYVAPEEEAVLPHPDDDRPLGFARSTDQGKTWKVSNAGITDKDISALKVDPQNGSTLFVGTRSGKIFKSNNGGSSWKNSSLGLGGSAVHDVAFDPENARIVYAAAGLVYKSTDAGRKWVLKNKGLPNGGLITSVQVSPQNPQTVFASSSIFGLFISTDAAENWTPFDTNGLGDFGINSILISPSNPDQFHIGTPRGVFNYTRSVSPSAPVIDQVDPPAARTGDTITINGRNFGPSQGDSDVTFAGVSAGAASSWSETVIEARVPSNAETGALRLITSGIRSNGFDFILLPSSGNLLPSSGSSDGGTRVTLLIPQEFAGTSYNVLFGSNLAGDLRFLAPNILVVTTPPGSGVVAVSIATNATSSELGNFSYE